MARIKVTGYIDTEELEATGVELDLSHETGLTASGFDKLSAEFGQQLDDVDFELVK